MKVYGGNGHRGNNKDSGSAARRSSGTGSNNINNSQKGNNNTGASRKKAEPPPEPKKKGGKGVLIALLIIVALIGGAYGYWVITTRPPDVGNDLENTGDQPDDALELIDTPTREIGHYYTVLVVGEDQLEENTDTIMLARFDAVEKKVNIVSIPRDTVVNVPWKVKKINTVYYNGDNGIDSLMDEVKNITGFRPDNYVVVKTSVFEKVIDALGGVWFDVPVDMDYGDYALLNSGESYEFTINVKKGYQLLNGYDALGVFRFRQNNDGTGYAMGDIERLDTQHDLIMAIAEQALKLNSIPKLYNMAQIVIENSQTDLTIGNLQWYVQKFMQMSMDDISISTMPTVGSWINGLSYVTINVDEWMTVVNEELNPMKYEIKPENCAIMCQKSPEPTRDSLTPGNYYTTNGTETYTNFYKYVK